MPPDHCLLSNHRWTASVATDKETNSQKTEHIPLILVMPMVGTTRIKCDDKSHIVFGMIIHLESKINKFLLLFAQHYHLSPPPWKLLSKADNWLEMGLEGLNRKATPTRTVVTQNGVIVWWVCLQSCCWWMNEAIICKFDATLRLLVCFTMHAATKYSHSSHLWRMCICSCKSWLQMQCFSGEVLLLPWTRLERSCQFKQEVHGQEVDIINHKRKEKCHLCNWHLQAMDKRHNESVAPHFSNVQSCQCSVVLCKCVVNEMKENTLSCYCGDAMLMAMGKQPALLCQFCSASSTTKADENHATSDDTPLVQTTRKFL